MGDQSPHFHGCQIDPEATLSNVDLVKLLMNDASSKTADLWKDVMKELDLDRNHNKEVNKQIVEGLGKRIDALERYISSSLDRPSSNVPPTPEPPQHTFTCYLCPHSFHSLSSLDEHIVANHPSMLCEECGQTLRSKPDLYLHQHRHHSQTLEHASSVLCSPDRDCPGPTCDSSEQYHTVLSENVNEIQQSSDKIPCLVCDKCDSTFHCNSDLDNHIKSHHTLPVLYNRFLGPESQIRGSPSPHPMLFHCFECDYRFLTQKHLVEHVRAKHGVSAIHACPNCETIFVSSEFLERHKQTCHEFYNTWPTPAPFFSPVSETPNINAALIHCKTCEATFNDMRQLNIHSLEHNEVTEVSNSTIEYINNDKQSGDPRAITYSTSTQLTSPPPIGDISDILQVDGIDDTETELEVAMETSTVVINEAEKPHAANNPAVYPCHIQEYDVASRSLSFHPISNISPLEVTDSVLVEFNSHREINTIFKHIRHLPMGSTVRRFIHPNLKDKHKNLSEKAVYLRKNEQLQTKILYDADSLTLFYKQPGEKLWSRYEQNSPLPDLSSSTLSSLSPSAPSFSPIPQADGINDSNLTACTNKHKSK